MMRLTFFLSVIFIFLALAVIYVALADVVSPLIIHIDPIRMSKVLGTRTDVLRLAVTGLILVFLNGLVAKIIRRRHAVAGLILLWTSALVAFLIFVAVSGIILIN